MKIENRQKTLIILTAVALGLLVGVDFVFDPLQALWSQRQQEITGLRGQVRDGTSLVRRDAAIRNHWNDMRNNTLKSDSAVAERDIIGAFNEWSRDSGVEITSLLPQWKNDTDDYQTLNCHVDVAGTLSTLSQFLYYVERGPMGLRLDSMELSTRDSSGQQMTLSLQVSGLSLVNQNSK